jgi:hypothetical protein
MKDLKKITYVETNEIEFFHNEQSSLYNLLKKTEPLMKYVNLSFMAIFSIFATISGWLAFNLFHLSSKISIICLFYMGFCLVFSAVFKKKSGY